ncbi:hypothetical protein LX15_005180 [Streptoalloteichus tenebrarius]|uniref:Uncharacterized protein n=1 Tax=Streptoalloteichus tenebrarius (strain ATCC 17920 / DSM 40477 / JCM 4838 / CBS 697.72 / NBRC 16177 / NCIMB 11028 / NRRL B-12390 / A12253. 1 / ISP 5477) TaxID=1933 RepID=A0ABT1I122_STRSD|nr:hypothetical protein [Streptoalloteichus tenebrarius]MCP2261454.1 hypothetical protein [Streptoalloteichus tenebrarius]BFE99689.1 hypothetical protein GCM10020241_13650 [Streptoalloteichus tenebrarius]
MAVPEPGIPTNAFARSGDDPRDGGWAEPGDQVDWTEMSRQLQALHHQMLRAHAATLDAHDAIQERLMAGLDPVERGPRGRAGERR